MASIKLKHASGNSTILNSPAANPSSDVTLKLPSTTGSAGQVLKVASANHSATNAELEFAVGGKVVQSAYKQWNTVTSTSSTTGEEIDSSLRMTFTPILNNSLIVYSGFFSVGSSSTIVGFLELYKSASTDMSSPSVVYEHKTSSTGPQSGNAVFHTNGDLMLTVPLVVMEVSGNTTARTYSTFWALNSGSYALYNNAYNGAGSYVGTSSILIQEIVV